MKKGEGKATIEKKDEGKATIETIPEDTVDEDRERTALRLKRSRYEVRKYVEALIENGSLDGTSLSKEKQDILSKVEKKAGVCSRCRFRKGCDECDVFKAMRKMFTDELMASEPRKRGRPSKA